MMKVKVWRKRGPAPAPFVVKGRPWEAAARWLSQAIRLGNLPPGPLGRGVQGH